MVDKLDLLGVRYDYELELQSKYELAEKVSNMWKDNCFDEDFYDNCIDSICEEIGFESGVIPNEVYEIWDIIEKNYMD